MGIMLNRRRVCGSGNGTPYDYEVEYIETTGTQWIDSKFMLKNGDYIESEIYSPSNTISTFFGCCGADNSAAWGIFRTLANWIGYFPNNYKDTFAGITKTSQSIWTTIKQDYRKYSLLGYNFNYDSRFGKAANTDALVPLYILARNNNGVVADISGPGLKLKSFIIKLNDVNVMELIPVAKNNKGYMYDKVSGRLFGSAGTDDFIAGSRV